jgi:hypothetical protein
VEWATPVSRHTVGRARIGQCGIRADLHDRVELRVDGLNPFEKRTRDRLARELAAAQRGCERANG